MIKLFETTPDWKYYHPSDGDQQILQYWNNKSLGGGPLTQNLASKNVSGIKSPLKDMIKNSSTYGYFEIKNILVARKLYNHFLDV